MKPLCPAKNNDKATKEEPKHARSSSCQSVDDCLTRSKESIVSQELKYSERKEEASKRQENTVNLLNLSDL
jgi:hypothetical protein